MGKEKWKEILMNCWKNIIALPFIKFYQAFCTGSPVDLAQIPLHMFVQYSPDNLTLANSHFLDNSYDVMDIPRKSSGGSRDFL